MECKEYKTTRVEITFEKDDEISGNVVNQINALIKSGYLMVEAKHNSAAISSTLAFAKNEIDFK